MFSERRVAACVSLLLGLVPVLWVLLPDRFELALPLACGVLVAALLALLPRPRIISVIGTIGWSAAALALTAATLRFAPAAGLGFVGLLPLGAMLLTERTWTGVVALVVGMALALVPELGGDPTRLGWATQSQADMLGWLWLGNFAIWHATIGLTIWEHRQWIARRVDTLPVLDAAIRRDLQALASVASVVADPSLTGPVNGHGLTTDALGLAARIDDRVVLLGYIEGAPLATLSVGFGLTAAARAGARDPGSLLRIAHDQFEEVVPREAVAWLAVWDRRTGKLTTSRGTSNAFSRCVITPGGPASSGTATYSDGVPALGELVAQRTADLRLDGKMPMRMFALVFVGWWLALVATLLGDSVPLFVGAYGSLFVVHERLLRWSRQHGSMRDDATALVQERSADHDDLRFALVRHHGTLLPYCIEADGVRALAHRLQGEVLDGTFADMVLTGRGRLRIVAGEVAGRGVAARFLGLAAQMITRVMLERNDRELSLLTSDVLASLRPLAGVLRWPPKLRLGLVQLGPDGNCRGAGALGNLIEVEVRPAAQTPEDLRSPEERVAMNQEARVGTTSTVYLTPAPAIPGPEDEAPALGRKETALRAMTLLRQGAVTPGQDSLPTLFSTVFNGVDAPAYGTLIELSST